MSERDSVESDALRRARDTAQWDSEQGPGTSHSPDARTVPWLLSGILEALIAIAEKQPTPRPIPPAEGES